MRKLTFRATLAAVLAVLLFASALTIPVAAGKPSPAATDNPFSDVKPEDYFYDAVLWAVEKKLTAGTTKSTFSPDEGTNRHVPLAQSGGFRS